MQSRTKSLLLNNLYVLAILLLASPAFSQLNSSTASVALTATLGETLTISATPNAVSFALLSSGVAAGSTPVVVTTTWILGSGRANVVLDAYFSNPAAALT